MQPCQKCCLRTPTNFESSARRNVDHSAPVAPGNCSRAVGDDFDIDLTVGSDHKWSTEECVCADRNDNQGFDIWPNHWATSRPRVGR